jgi:hypothetical protein
MSDILKIAFGIGCFYLIYTNFFGEESGCQKYSSNFSCNYLEKKAAYDVYYWRNVSEDDRNDEKYIGSVLGILQCKNMAISYAEKIREAWNDRSYICLLVKEGKNMEKHRLLY